MKNEELSGIIGKILGACYPAVVNNTPAPVVDLLRETCQLHKEDFWNIIMAIRGLALRNRLSMNQISLLNDACWSIGETSIDETEGFFFKRLAGNLKPITCEIFRGALSGGEVFYKGSHYSFTKLPGDMRRFRDIRFSISRLNTAEILSAYDLLVQRAGQEENLLMISHWQGQKKIFLYLLEQIAPKLLEPAPPAHVLCATT